MNYLELARRVAADTGTNAALPIVAQWAAERVVQVLNITRSESLRKEGEFVIPAAVTKGGATTTKGSRRVTFNATAKTEVAKQDWIVGASFKIDSKEEVYTVASKDGDGGGIDLTTSYIQASASAGAYRLFKRFHALNALARHVDHLYHSLGPIRRVDKGTLDREYPGKWEKSNAPERWAPAGRERDGRIRVEVWPVPNDEDVLVHFSFWEAPREPDIYDELPPFVDAVDIKSGVKVSVAKWEQAEAAKAGAEVLVAHWSKAEGVAQAEWRAYMRSIVMAGSATPYGSLNVVKGAPSRYYYGDQRDKGYLDG